MTTKTFDAVEMKRQGSLSVHRAIGNLSVEQQLAFWQQRTNALVKQQHGVATAQQDDQKGVEQVSATDTRR